MNFVGIVYEWFCFNFYNDGSYLIEIDMYVSV